MEGWEQACRGGLRNAEAESGGGGGLCTVLKPEDTRLVEACNGSGGDTGSQGIGGSREWGEGVGREGPRGSGASVKGSSGFGAWQAVGGRRRRRRRGQE